MPKQHYILDLTIRPENQMMEKHSKWVLCPELVCNWWNTVCTIFSTIQHIICGTLCSILLRMAGRKKKRMAGRDLWPPTQRPRVPRVRSCIVQGWDLWVNTANMRKLPPKRWGNFSPGICTLIPSVHMREGWGELCVQCLKLALPGSLTKVGLAWRILWMFFCTVSLSARI